MREKEESCLTKKVMLLENTREGEVKNKGRLKWRRMKKKAVRRGKEKSQNGCESKEDVKGLFRWRPMKSSVKGETCRVGVIFLGKTCGISLRTCLIVNLMRVRLFVWFLM